MNQYRIHDLERLTGVKAHCIRIWEKRYKIIVPSRTATNRRVYDSDQLLRLLNIATLVASGYKISHLARMSTAELLVHLNDMYTVPTIDSLHAPYLHDLIVAMVAFDEVAFGRIFDEVVERLGISSGMVNVIYPFLKKTNVLWRMGKMMASHEHFASTLIRQKLLVTISRLPEAKPDAPKYLLFLPEGEWNDLGLLLASYIIRSKGNNTFYLGQNIPYKDIQPVANAIRPEQIITFFVTPKTPEEICKGISVLTQEHSNMRIFVSGNEQLFSKLGERENVFYLTSMEGILEHI